MENKFENVPIDEGTDIIYQAIVNFGEYPVLYQKWRWEGIIAESLIFDSNDVGKLSDSEIEAAVRTSPLVHADSKVTISRSDSGFVFVNFNFST
jgi:hypothetical protein